MDKNNKQQVVTEMYLLDMDLKTVKDVGKKLDSIINVFKKIYYSGRVIDNLDVSYNHAKNTLINVIIENKLENEKEWDIIQNNFVIKAGQLFNEEMLNNVIENLEKLKIKALITSRDNNFEFFQMLHPQITEVSKSSFESGCYADSVESACKAINERLKRICKRVKGINLDGDSLFTTSFSANDPIIKLDKDISTPSGKNIQKGYMFIFQGLWSAIRDPKAHENLKIIKREAIEKLYLTSLLMYKIDDGLKISNITED